MAQKETIIIIALLCCLAVQATTPGNATAQGGNITPLNIANERQTNSWQGLVGNLIIVGANQTNITATGGQINQTDIVITSACTNPTVTGTILFSNSSTTPFLLTPGNLSQLDTFLTSSADSGSATFPNTSTFTIGGTPIAGVPTTNTYVNSNPQALVFREGYLNDASDNIVFAIAINLDTTGYNGTTYDYQAILALFANMTTPYYISTDLTVICPGGGGGGGGSGGGYHKNVSYLGAIVERLPEIQIPKLPPRITKEEIKTIDELQPLILDAPNAITATIGATLETPITLSNPNVKTAPLITVALRIPSVIDSYTPLHSHPRLYRFFGLLPLHSNTHTTTFPPIAPTFHEVPPSQSFSLTLANEIPVTHPATVEGTIEAYAGNRLLATRPITIHLVPPKFALTAKHDGNQIIILLLLNNQRQSALVTKVELDYNSGRTTSFAELYSLPLSTNTVELFGYTYKPAFAYDTITASSDFGRKEAH